MQDNYVELHVDKTEQAALVIDVIGRVDGMNAEEFFNNLNKEIDNSDKPVVLDLEKLTYISSAGLRSIFHIAQILKSKNTKFMLCSLSGSVKGIVEIAGFNKIIDVAQSRSAAISEITC